MCTIISSSDFPRNWGTNRWCILIYITHQEQLSQCLNPGKIWALIPPQGWSISAGLTFWRPWQEGLPSGMGCRPAGGSLGLRGCGDHLQPKPRASAVLGISPQNRHRVFSVSELAYSLHPQFLAWRSPGDPSGKKSPNEQVQIWVPQCKTRFAGKARSEASFPQLAFTPDPSQPRKSTNVSLYRKSSKGWVAQPSAKSRESLLDTTEQFGGAWHPCGRAGHADRHGGDSI